MGDQLTTPRTHDDTTKHVPCGMAPTWMVKLNEIRCVVDFSERPQHGCCYLGQTIRCKRNRVSIPVNRAELGIPIGWPPRRVVVVMPRRISLSRTYDAEKSF